MAASSIYYELLGVKPGSDHHTVKRAYHRLVRENHPDLFPDKLKEVQELKMVQINEAYSRIAKDGWNGADTGIHDMKECTAPVPEQAPASAGQIGRHRDIEYAYYKQGFTNYSRALAGIKHIEREAGPRNDLYYIRRFSKSLSYLRRADTYFSRLVEEYPDSMWARDARIKIGRAEYFYRLYRKILQNLEQRLRAEMHRRSALRNRRENGPKTDPS
jgi:hypothetical protein